MLRHFRVPPLNFGRKRHNPNDTRAPVAPCILCEPHLRCAWCCSGGVGDCLCRKGPSAQMRRSPCVRLVRHGLRACAVVAALHRRTRLASHSMLRDVAQPVHVFIRHSLQPSQPWSLQDVPQKSVSCHSSHLNILTPRIPSSFLMFVIFRFYSKNVK